MSISAYSREELEELSMVEVAFHVLKEEKQTFSYFDLIKRVVELKGMSEEQMKQRISYLYTELNVDGRFMCIGDNVWGLKAWYPIEKIEEDIITAKPRKKAKATDDEDEIDVDEDFEDFEDEFEEIEDELDELADDEDSDDFEEEDLDGFSDDDEEEEEFEEDDEEAIEDDDELS
ncbi:DNA-directed RNA polymerase subunit delta [Alkalihalobacillus sp. BA299]|uniref:DNA-directed RNA polymerase subunit delta n=1 Tax=Alkalihalobacillus sp. BA299 TaxID=2815938 RepID=UPI001ADB21CA|nr:DNA-directed RNA polymerase subunit delta [Alkalihalobacillus sp. BA299]